MTCVIKKSLFTHQKPRRSEAESAWQNVFTHQEINNLSYVLLSHLHRSLIALPRRHTPAWLYEKGAKQRNIQKGKREVSAGAADKTYLIHREGWIHQHFLELNLSILLICKEWVKFCPRQKKKILSQSFSWTIGTLKVHETRVSISVLWKQKMELSLVCKELSVNDGSECTHTHSPDPLSWVLRLGNFSVISWESPSYHWQRELHSLQHFQMFAQVETTQGCSSPSKTLLFPSREVPQFD